MGEGSSSNVTSGGQVSGEECGYSVRPKADCAHVSDGRFRTSGALGGAGDGAGGKGGAADAWGKLWRCEACGDVGETWVCVPCGAHLCGRYRHGHMVQHSENMRSVGENGHDVVAISTADLSCWCFLCDDYVTNAKLNDAYDAMHALKFGRPAAFRVH